MKKCDLFGFSGNIFALLYFFTPMKDMYGLFTGKVDVNKLPYLIFVFNLLNCVFWMAYGFLPNLMKIPVYVCNSIGTIQYKQRNNCEPILLDYLLVVQSQTTFIEDTINNPGNTNHSRDILCLSIWD